MERNVKFLFVFWHLDKLMRIKYINNVLNTYLEVFMNTPIRIAQVGSECVACGCCVPTCPKKAIHIESGVRARIDENKCVGCGKCAKTCPAAVITIVQRRVAV